MREMRAILFRCAAVAAACALPAVMSAQGTGQDTSGTRVRDSVPQHHRRVTTDTSNGAVSGTARNQDQSGVTNSNGKSTLGPKVKKTTPTSDQAVTAKGDTLSGAADSSAAARKHTQRMHMRDSTTMRDSMPQ
jgi:hypothetical protein